MNKHAKYTKASTYHMTLKGGRPIPRSFLKKRKAVFLFCFILHTYLSTYVGMDKREATFYLDSIFIIEDQTFVYIQKLY